MKLAFSLDAMSSSAQKSWRLGVDEQWHVCQFSQDVGAEDYLIDDPDELKKWQGKRLKKTNTGMVVSDKAGLFDFLMRGNFVYPVLQRFSAPTLPSKENLEQCIRHGRAGKAQLLYLNLAGQFSLLDTTNNPIIGNLNIAVRGEIASSSLYVGADVSQIFLDIWYVQFLHAWLEHLKCKRLGIFIPEPHKTKSEDEITADILNWQPQTVIEGR
ncbi:MAG: hypothetical protein Q9M28_10240 [Mariprofundaceae bacterium]|nr:hypothetical protein [Mariprofundaceae bacterium]